VGERVGKLKVGTRVGMDGEEEEEVVEEEEAAAEAAEPSEAVAAEGSAAPAEGDAAPASKRSRWGARVDEESQVKH
jgi:hypothetical protein